MSPRRLKQLFRYFNVRYWRGRLPEYEISFEPLPSTPTSEILAWCDVPRQTLRFDPAKLGSDREWRQTLLHEMAHILAARGHGKQFLDELCRGPKYSVLAYCAGDKDAFAVLQYGPLRARAAARRLNIFPARRGKK